MKKISITIISLIFLVACTKEEVTSRAYPRVITNEVDVVTSTGTTFHGEITFSSTEIVNHGFIWSTFSSMSIGYGNNIPLGQKTGTGKFESKLQFNLVKGVKYYVMAYAQSSKYTVYGNVVEFELPK